MTKTITTTREYDEKGRLIKETVSEVTTPDAYVAPYAPLAAACTCGRTTACPLHGIYRQQPYITYGGSTVTTTNSGRLAHAIRAEMKANVS